MRRIKLVFWLLLISLSTHASFGPLRFIPPQPTTNDIVRFRVETIACDIFLNSLSPVIEVNGNVIKVTEVGLTTEGSTFCLFPRSDFEFNIGRFAPGTYSIELYIHQAIEPFTIRLARAGEVTVTQGPATITSIPTMGHFGSLALGLLLLVFGLSSAGTAKRLSDA